MQAGSSFEHITGGYVLSGYHEVMYNEDTKRALENVKEQIAVSGKERILWRVSSTLFSHFRGEVDISPMRELAHLMDPVQAGTYKRMTAFEKLMEELRATSMTADTKKE